MNSSLIESGIAKSDGRFTVTIPVQKAGTTLKISVTDTSDNSSTPVGIVVKNVNGWAKQNGAIYYYNSGKKVTGWSKIGANWYYFEGNGAMKTGWLKIGEDWYYFDGNGRMKTGWVTITDKGTTLILAVFG